MTKYLLAKSVKEIFRVLAKKFENKLCYINYAPCKNTLTFKFPENKNLNFLCIIQ